MCGRILKYIVVNSIIKSVVKNIKIGDIETIQKFDEIKEFLGVKDDSEVLRVLINYYYR